MELELLICDGKPEDLFNNIEEYAHFTKNLDNLDKKGILHSDFIIEEIENYKHIICERYSLSHEQFCDNMVRYLNLPEDLDDIDITPKYVNNLYAFTR